MILYRAAEGVKDFIETISIFGKTFHLSKSFSTFFENYTEFSLIEICFLKLNKITVSNRYFVDRFGDERTVGRSAGFWFSIN